MVRNLSDAPARRFIIELPPELAEQLHSLCVKTHTTRAAAIRTAIADFVSQCFGRTHVLPVDRVVYNELLEYCSALGDAEPDRVAVLAIQSYLRRRIAADPELRLEISSRRDAQRELPFRSSPHEPLSGKEAQNAGSETVDATSSPAYVRRGPKRAETNRPRAGSRKAG